jgi:hypothetical protein
MKYCKYTADDLKGAQNPANDLVSASYYFFDQRSVGGWVKLKHNQFDMKPDEKLTCHRYFRGIVHPGERMR